MFDLYGRGQHQPASFSIPNTSLVKLDSSHSGEKLHLHNLVNLTTFQDGLNHGLEKTAIKHLIITIVLELQHDLIVLSDFVLDGLGVVTDNSISVKNCSVTPCYGHIIHSRTGTDLAVMARQN